MPSEGLPLPGPALPCQPTLFYLFDQKVLNSLLTGDSWQGHPRLILKQQSFPQDRPPLIDELSRKIVACRCLTAYQRLYSWQIYFVLICFYKNFLPWQRHTEIEGNPLPSVANILALYVNWISRFLLTFAKPKGGGPIKSSCSTDASLLSYNVKSCQSRITLTFMSLSSVI